MAWIPSTARSTSDNPGGLIMKAKAFTPVVQRYIYHFLIVKTFFKIFNVRIGYILV